MACIGAGTGLGECYLTPIPGATSVATEQVHNTAKPQDRWFSDTLPAKWIALEGEGVPCVCVCVFVAVLCVVK